MIAKLKQTAFGKTLYRLSRSSFGGPLRWSAAALQNEAIQPAHLAPANRRHNRTQAAILARFEARISKSGPHS
ncbi:hypothetical protein [Phaeobacter sp. B1627]|uniref:hypothetical protein n=1 Tax=Phaeobacter sp. B1627 TaxID=2583809 RepID=UPI00111AAC13|nr:hypothetical protein [Phaeobacter sp. B1627]TNJ40939.1 hypothetical protein FGE21_15675 [Phaeobacter sp. B1627]